MLFRSHPPNPRSQTDSNGHYSYPSSYPPQEGLSHSQESQQSLPNSQESLPQCNRSLVDCHNAAPSPPCFFELSFIKKKKSKNRKIFGNENEKNEKELYDGKSGKDVRKKKNSNEAENYEESCVVAVGNGCWCVGYVITALLSYGAAESAGVDVIDYEVRMLWNVNLSVYTKIGRAHV